MASALSLKLAIQCSGVDAAGKSFEERTHTVVIQRNGGRLLTRHKLQTGARLQLRLQKRDEPLVEVELKELVESENLGYEWSFEFAGPAQDFWGVRFPSDPPAASLAGSPAAAAAAAKMSEELALLAQHAEDHLRHCTQEVEGLRERFAKEMKAALDGATRQLHQVVRAHMETTFRSLLDELAQRAEDLVEKNLAKLRKGVEQTGVQHAKYLDDEAEAHIGKFQERLDQQTRQMADRLDKMQSETESTLQQSVEAVIQQFEAGFSGLLRELQHAAESHKPSHAAAARRK